MTEGQPGRRRLVKHTVFITVFALAAWQLDSLAHRATTPAWHNLAQITACIFAALVGQQLFDLVQTLRGKDRPRQITPRT